MVLSWGPPNAPYETAPEKYRAQYRPEDIQLRANVPPEKGEDAAEWIAGYYAHCTALDDCMALRRVVTSLAEGIGAGVPQLLRGFALELDLPSSIAQVSVVVRP